MVGFFSVPNVWRNIKISRDNDPNTVWPFFDGLHSLLELFGFRSTLAITIPIIFERMENFDFKRTNCVLDQWTVICSIIKCEKGESHLARGLEHEL